MALNISEIVVCLLFKVIKILYWIAALDVSTVAHASVTDLRGIENNSSTVSMLVGQRRQLTLKNDADLAVSRKGIVEVTSIAPGKFSIVAIKAGHVLLKVKSTPNAPDPNPNATDLISIHVTRLDNVPVTGGLALLCKSGVVACTADGRKITGSIDSVPDYFAVARICSQVSVCFNKTILSERALRTLRDLLVNLFGSAFQRIDSKNGFYYGYIDCIRDRPDRSEPHSQALQKLHKYAPWFRYSPRFILLCTQQHANFRIDIVFENHGSYSRSKSDLLDSKFSRLHPLLGGHTEFSNPVRTGLEALGEAYTSQTGGRYTLGHPQLVTSIGTKSSVRASLNFAGIDPKLSDVSVVSEIELRSHDVGWIVLIIDAHLSRKSKIIGRIQTTTRLPLDKDWRIASIQVSDDENSSQFSTVFSQIPILGPLFKSDKGAVTASAIDVNVKVVKLSH